MRAATQHDLKSLLDYLWEDVGNALYLYMDIGQYGLMNPSIRIWLEEKNGVIACVIMKYYSSFQLYARGNVTCIQEIRSLIHTFLPEMISGPDFLIRMLQPEINGVYHYGTIFQIQNYREFENLYPIEQAQESDSREIAELMCMAPIFGNHYQIENLTIQLKDRIASGAGRSYIIRINRKIIAHCSTFAEYKSLAMTSGLVVHPDYQGISSYGTILESHLFCQLLKEGKQVYTQVQDKRRRQLLQSLGGTIIGGYGTIEHPGL